MDSKPLLITQSAFDAFKGIFMWELEKEFKAREKEQNKQSGSSETEVTAMGSQINTLTLTDAPHAPPP